mgnify:CR=1 FL=1
MKIIGGFNSNVTLADITSNIHVASNGNIGIGTSSPSELLNISSGAATHAKILIDAGADADLILDKGAGSRRSHIDYKIAGTTKWYAGTADSDVVGDGDDYFIGTTVGGTNAEFFLKRSNGYIGAGTTSPASKLHVHGGDVRISSANDGGSNLQFRNETTPNALLSNSYNINSGSKTDFNAYVYGNNPYSIWTNNTNRLSVTGAGKVGIGVAAPASLLHVAGTVQVGVDDTGHDVTFFGATSGKKLTWDESADGLYFADNTFLRLGTGGDVKMWHNGTDSYIMNLVGDLNLLQSANDKDIILSSDDGSGGTTPYLTLDGSAGYTTVQKNMVFADSISSRFGTGGDLAIFHNGSQGYISLEGTGDLYIRNTTNDKDVIFQSDDGAGGTATYFFLDGSLGTGNDYHFTKFPDKSTLVFGDGSDLQIRHDGSNTYLTNYGGNMTFSNNANDKDIIFKSDDGSGGTATYFKLDGSLATHDGSSTLTMYTKWDDNSIISLGTGNDIRLYHNGTNSYLDNLAGDYYIRQKADDKDIIFQCDDGSGGTTAYLTLDGSSSRIEVTKNMRFADSVSLLLGGSSDLQLLHDGSNSYINANGVGDLYIKQNNNDKDIIFQSDDGSGGVTAYLTLDGSGSQIHMAKPIRFPDSVSATWGAGGDLEIFHNGTYSNIANKTGHLYIDNNTDDGDIVFRSDDGSGGLATYMTIDGGLGYTTVQKRMKFDDNTQLQFGNGGDLQFFHTGGVGVLYNNTGNFTFRQNANDKDLIFQSDDGAGGVTTYFSLDGSEATHDGSATTNLYTIWPDNSRIALGTGKDIRILHNGTGSFFDNTTGDLYFRNFANDKDIIFQSDDGSGGVETYFFLDGSANGGDEPYTVWPDSSIASWGDGADFRIKHDGSHAYLYNTTGNIKIINYADDEDIIFQSDDGSGGVETYFKLDGSASSGSPVTIFPDNSGLKFGDGQDLAISHNGSHSYITQNGTGNLYIQQNYNDGDLILQSDNGSGGMTAYLTLDGGDGHTIANKEIQFVDGVPARFGSGNDMAIRHTGSHSFVSHDGTGNLYIDNTADDTDTIFRCDDGSGGTTAYLTLDGSAGNMKAATNMRFSDSKQLQLGDSGDLSLQHDGSASYISNSVGNVFITQNANDGDIFFKSDDGSGGTAIYFSLDGSAGTIEVAKPMNLVDDLTITGGNGGQLTITSGNVAHDATIDLDTGDSNGQWRIKAEGSDETFHIANVDQGGTSAFSIHPTTKAVTLATPLATDQQKHVMHYDFQGYATGDGTNYEMVQAITDTNAPFEHNTSLGEDGTTATTVQNIIRSGGKTMPRACTLTRWTGWAAAAGSQTAYVALFKVTPTRNNNTDLSAVLLDAFSYTALGNAKMESFNETSFTATAIEAGDILITAMKSQSGAVHYFTSTVEVEF